MLKDDSMYTVAVEGVVADEAYGDPACTSIAFAATLAPYMVFEVLDKNLGSKKNVSILSCLKCYSQCECKSELCSLLRILLVQDIAYLCNHSWKILRLCMHSVKPL